MAHFGRTPWQRGASLALAAIAWAAVAWVAPGLAAERLPIFDTHVHYSREAWSPYPPEAVLKKFDDAGVPRALVSSTPDAGTLALHETAPERVVPILRPYRDRGDMADWFRKDAVMAYVTERLDRGLPQGLYRGIGEFHLMDLAEAGTPQMRGLTELAVARGLVLHVHSGASKVEALFALAPNAKIIWAHAGMGAPPEVIGDLLDRYDTLWTELSFRAGDVAPGEDIEPAWRELLLRHQDRFMIGSDTYVNARWEEYQALVGQHRAWVRRLPPEVAKAIAYGNAVRLFGAGPPGTWDAGTD